MCSPTTTPPSSLPGTREAAAPPAARTVLLRADATPRIGVGHVMRLLALAQELIARGVTVHLAGQVDVAWVARACDAAGIVREPAPATPDDLVASARRLGARWCVLDRYDLGAAWGSALRRGGITVMAMVDDSFGGDQDADLYVDQNPGATPRAVDAYQKALAGAQYTLFRDDVLHLRRDALPAPGDPPRVLAVFGGTDPCGAAPILTRLALATGCAMELTVITPDDAWARDVDVAPGQHLRTIGPVGDLAERAAASDVVITASGSSVWELLCLGVPLAVVCVIDNQTPGYDMVVRSGLAAGVGHLDALREPDDAGDVTRRAVRALRETFCDDDVRAARVARGQALLDGRGRVRVADALLALGSRSVS